MIGGFNDQGDGTEVKTNRVTITKGDVQGPVYGGLSFVSKIFADVDKSAIQSFPITQQMNKVLVIIISRLLIIIRLKLKVM